MAKNKKMVSITLDIKLVEELKRYSQQSLIPMSALISRLLESFLKIGENEIDKLESFLSNNELDEASKEVLLYRHLNKAIDDMHKNRFIQERIDRAARVERHQIEREERGELI